MFSVRWGSPDAYDTRRVVIIALAIFTIQIGKEFVSERNLKIARKTGKTYRARSLPKNLTFRVETFPQKAIDDFLNSDAEEIYISKMQLDREFAKSIQKHYQIDPYNKTYFSVKSFLEIRRLVIPAIMFFIYSIAYIVMTEVKEKRRANQSNDLM